MSKSTVNATAAVISALLCVAALYFGWSVWACYFACNAGSQATLAFYRRRRPVPN